ncbi:MAG: hypothetical protein Q7T33_06055 [Dehalococcoidia bacterium]|nr:hypothetical protein [Dehalococcoidia bacterium]
MSIENRDLKPGTKLLARYKKQEYACEVVKTGDVIRYRLEDGQEFKSLSSAGSSVMGGSACNGWRFWSVAGEEPVKPAKKANKAGEQPKPATNPRKAKAPKPSSGFRRLEDGRFWCDACADAFTAPQGVEPIGCPQGHEPGQATAG